MSFPDGCTTPLQRSPHRRSSSQSSQVQFARSDGSGGDSDGSGGGGRMSGTRCPSLFRSEEERTIDPAEKRAAAARSLTTPSPPRLRGLGLGEGSLRDRAEGRWSDRADGPQMIGSFGSPPFAQLAFWRKKVECRATKDEMT